MKWNCDGGINRNAHSDYLAQLCGHFQNSVTKLVELAMKTRSDLSENELVVEVLSHSRLGSTRCGMFQGRTELLGSIRTAIDKGPVVVIHGQSGCGKTSVLAKTASLVTFFSASKYSDTVYLCTH